jgi:thermitase
MESKHLPVLFFVAFLSFLPMGMRSQTMPHYSPDHILVRFIDGLNPVLTEKNNRPVFDIPAVDAMGEKYGCTVIRNLTKGRKNPGGPVIYLVEFSSHPDIPAVAEDYMKTGCFRYTEPDFTGVADGHPATDSLMPNDTYFDRQWALYNDGTFPLYPAKIDADIDMTEGWTVETGDTNVVTCILDSGDKLNHPEFMGRIWINYGEIPGNMIDDDGNGYIDDVNGWDFVNNDNDPTDDEGHGTNVTGIIGAKGNNNYGYAGVDWKCKLMILKGINSAGWGYYSWWISAIQYAVDNGAQVINMSLVGTDVSQALQDEIKYAIQNNVAVIACMGNDNNNETCFPASYTGVIAVGATNPDDTRCNPFFWGGGSNYNTYISVVAPGNYIYGLDYQSNSTFNIYWGGTSQATPHVTGLYSLLLAKYPGSEISFIRNIIEATAQDTVGDPSEDTPGWDPYYGHGRINAYQALVFNPLAIRENRMKEFTISPNPTTGRFRILAGDREIKNGEIRISDITGRALIRENISGRDFFDISRFVKGIYFITVDEGNSVFTGKVILE